MWGLGSPDKVRQGRGIPSGKGRPPFSFWVELRGLSSHGILWPNSRVSQQCLATTFPLTTPRLQLVPFYLPLPWHKLFSFYMSHIMQYLSFCTWIILFFFKIYLFVIYKYCCCLQTHQKRASDLITDGCESLCGSWDLNSGPLEEQSVLLTTEPFFQPYLDHST